MDRRQLIISLASAGVGTAALGTGIWLKRDPSRSNNQSELEYIIERASKSIEAEKEHLREAFIKLNNYSSVSINQNGQILPITDYDLKKGFEENTVVVCKSDSQFLRPFYDKMQKSDANMVVRNVRYVIFAPNLKRDLGFMVEPVNGLSLGNGVIAIDSQSGFLTIPSGMRHEASHEYTHEKLRTLDSEANATDVEISVIDYQRSNEKDPANVRVLDNMLIGAKEVQATANYLRKFGNTFREVYPRNVVLSKDLLGAEITSIELEKAMKSALGDYGIAEEVRHAAKAAFIAKTDKKRAIAQFYSTVRDPASSSLTI